MIKKILVPSDFSSVSRAAEEKALEIAKAVGASVTLLHAVEPVEGAEDDDEYIKSFLETQREKALAKASGTAKMFHDADVKCDVRVEPGRRAEVIIGIATKEDFDLVVLGSRMMRDGKKVYVGTTTHRVFFQAAFPLLIVPVE